MKKKMKKKNEEENEKENEKEKSDIFFEKLISNELSKGEEIKIIKEENLIDKKISFDNISTKQSEFNINNIDYKSYKNEKLKKLLNSSEDENGTPKENNKNAKKNIMNRKNNENNNPSSNEIKQNQNISNKNINYIFGNDNNYNSNSSENYASPINKKIHRNHWNTNFLAIKNDISFKVESSYDNLNLISGDKLIKNKTLQDKIKIFLLEEIHNSSNQNYNYKNIPTTNNNMIKDIKKMNTLGISTHNNNLINYFDSIKEKSIKPSNIKYNRNNKYNNNNDNNNFNHNSTISFSKLIHRSSLHKMDHLNRNHFSTLNENEFDDKLYNKRHEKMKSNKNNNNNNYIKNRTIDIQKKLKGYKIAHILSPSMKSKRQKNNLLSQININIQKTNQKLNNPDEFYSNYFNSILGKKNKPNRNTVFFERNNIDLSNIQKEKINTISSFSKIN